MEYRLESSVMVIDLFPGISETTLRHLLFTPQIKGIVLRTFGAGNAPTSPWFIQAVKEACESGRIILNVTQCHNGSVHPERYVAGDMLAATGVISGRDITTEAALTKMMHLFGIGLSGQGVIDAITRPLCGEMTPR